MICVVVEECGGMPDFEDKEGEVRYNMSRSMSLNVMVTLKTALHKATLNGHLPVIRYLVSAGADVHAQDGDGWTPLHNACSKVQSF